MQTFWPATLFNGDPSTSFFLWYLQIFNNTYFEEHLQTIASELIIRINCTLQRCRVTYYDDDKRDLKYYAALKLRKLESLFYKTGTCLQKTTTCIGLQTEQIFSVNILYACFFAILAGAFAVLFLCYFQKLQLLVVKRFWANFCYIVLPIVWAQKACIRFLRSYFKLEILIFLSFVVSFLVDMFN